MIQLIKIILYYFHFIGGNATENLYSYVPLLQTGFCSFEQYNRYLDDIFSKDSKNELLLELELCSNDFGKTISTITYVIESDLISIDYDNFGRLLFKELNDIYLSNLYTIEDFGKKVYALWNLLPHSIHQNEPFWTLCYADDCLSWGDEKQTRELYEKAFDYYK